VLAARYDLLDVLDAALRADDAAPGFSGTLCLAVVGERRRALRVQLDGSARGAFVPEAVDADLRVVMDEETAAHVLQGDLPERPKLLEVHGDTTLLERFVARYLTQKRPLDLRVERRRGRR
jgi:hypothetical protein